MTMSMRKIFNKVEKHLLKQNVKSANKHGGCKYRDQAGRMCAVGCLITDDMYDPYLEGESVDACEVIEVLNPILGVNEKKREQKLALLRRLQYVHDDHRAENWAAQLAKIKHELGIA